MTLAFDSFVLCASAADLSVVPAAREAGADAVEFRMDLADEPLTALSAYDGDLPVLATNRARWEGGAADAADRLTDLAAAAREPAVAAVDVELAALRGRAAAEAGDDVVAAARDHDAAVVVSVHDFAGTPTEDAMTRLLRTASRLGDVGKLAVTAADRADALAVLSATRAADEAGATVATMAMGESGRHTRAVAPLYGSRIGYAPVDPADATAPGQYDAATLARLVETLRAAPVDAD
ncbi:MAG: type I 3-dehydroquinate dehydratase [Halolamina sp.]